MKELMKLALISLLFVIPMLILKVMRQRKIDRRNALATLRLSDTEKEELAEDFVMYARLPDDLKNELEGLIHVFNAEKAYAACGGLEEVTPRMQRVIAAQACLLLLRRRHDLYRKLRTINVYPDAYVAVGANGEESVRLGESWTTGSIVLSWASVIKGGRNMEDGHNVTVHEFTHQLDQADGAGDGVPYLDSVGSYREWASTMKPAFDELKAQIKKRKPTVIDDYGAVNPAEFFAVTTETFYEKPAQLKEEHPDLYNLMSEYYGVDPLEW